MLSTCKQHLAHFLIASMSRFSERVDEFLLNLWFLLSFLLCFPPHVLQQLYNLNVTMYQNKTCIQNPTPLMTMVQLIPRVAIDKIS